MAAPLISPTQLQRRQWLVWAASLSAGAALPAHAAVPVHTVQAPRMAAAWEAAHGYQIGVLAQRGGALRIRDALDVPTRAHGVWVEKTGALLAVARRPGDWMLRWKPGSKTPTWGWIEADRAFNGHVVASADGKTLYTTETDLETGLGFIGVRDAATLEKTAEWPTHGMDPHELLLDADGSLVVANGGIPALPETGRLKIGLERMDASLVRLDTRTGQLLGQWRLADKRLSLRHMAWGPVASHGNQRLLGIALQAEHDDAAAKTTAPLLAVFDGRQLATHGAGAGQSLAGYGGDIAFAAGRFAVSCPRANGVALWQADGQWAGFIALDEACALASVTPAGRDASGDSVSRLWAGGRLLAVSRDSEGHASQSPLRDMRLDNHWTPFG